MTKRVAMIKVFNYSKYVFILLFLFILFLTYLVVKPVLFTILGAAIFAYLVYPLYRFLQTRMKKRFAAFITMMALTLVIILPLAIILNAVTSELIKVYGFMQTRIFAGDIVDNICRESQVLCNVITNIGTPEDVQLFVKDMMKNGINFLISQTTGIIRNIPEFILQLMVFYVATFAFLVHGNYIIKRMWQMLPMSRKHRTKIMKAVSDMFQGVMYGHVLTAIAQGFVATIGYIIFGVPHPFLLGFLTLVASFVPFIGTTLIWIPIAAYMLFSEYINGSSLWPGMLLLLYGTFIISVVDNIIKPRIVGKHTGTHPVVIFIGLIGGIAAFGLIGMVIGPLILSLFIVFIEFYEAESK
ncbi:MAG: AI-2E family transporter [Nanoarchaeota archaeon]